MNIHYKFNNQDYFSVYQLRQAIYQERRIAFGQEPGRLEDEDDATYFSRLVAFWTSYDVTPYEYKAPVIETTDEEKAANIRMKRNRLLDATDKYATIDYPKGDFQSEVFAYRQALRDLPQQEGFPVRVTWPVRPEEKK